MNQDAQDFSVGVQHRIFNNEVRSRRLAMGLTQKQLGALIDRGGIWVSHLENFRFYPIKELANELAEILNVNVNVLFPPWLKIFKPKRTLVITEHIVNAPLLDSHISQHLLANGEDQFRDMFDKNLLKEGIAEVLTSLKPRERQILELRFGIGGNKPKDLESLGRIFGVTRERIRQIEAKALMKLKHPTRRKKMQNLL